MKTIFDIQVQQELITRINQLAIENKAQWGKMNAYQMVKHCVLWEEMAQNKKVYKRTLLGRIFGKYALSDFIGDATPFKQNVPTIRDLKVKETEGDIALLKNNWIRLIEAYKDQNKTGFVHPFFGKLNQEQLGYLSYKHNDHHLRQFTV